MEVGQKMGMRGERKGKESVRWRKALLTGSSEAQREGIVRVL